ncbi:MAG: MBL fold metallo-hydrolase [Bacteroidia bacterium]|nr:MBL fold metallo-hydrolase [Bacteroidia bacterium]MDW8236038.1 MBL fold metallo-hydrolase [Bacteroidia bacterium]
MRIRRFITNPYQENSYLLIGSGGMAWIIDPGFYTASERRLLQNFLQAEKVQLVGIYLTHTHIDHILGVRWLVEEYHLPVYYHANEEPVYAHAAQWAQMMGLAYEPGPPATAYLQGTETLYLDSEPIQVFFVPGHSPGHVAFYAAESRNLLSGDVLFRGSIGNYELPLADYNTLMHSLEGLFLRLPDDVTVWPGHGEPTTIGYERVHNPFLASRL